MDPYIGQKLVSHKQTEMRAEAKSQRLTRLASIGPRPLWPRALDRVASVIQRVTPRLSIADSAWILEHWGLRRRVPETASRPWSAPGDATRHLAEGQLGTVDRSAGVVTPDR